MILPPSDLLASAVAGGFVLGLATLLSLGPQNLRLIEAGLTRSHPGPVATTGYLSESLVVAAGVALVVSVASSHPQVVLAMRSAGVVFLVWCGLASLMATAAPEDLHRTAGTRSRGAAIRSMLIVTWLNPVVHLEVMLLVGLLSASCGRDRGPWFGVGSLIASALRFDGWTVAAWGSRTSPFAAPPPARLVLRLRIGPARRGVAPRHAALGVPSLGWVSHLTPLPGDERWASLSRGGARTTAAHRSSAPAE